MKIGSLNIRGLGAEIKKKKIRSFIKEEKLDFMVIQETKIESIDRQFCEQLWGGNDCAWLSLPAIGNTGGLLSLCNANLGNLMFSFLGSGFCSVCLEWGSKKIKCFVVNIYSLCTILIYIYIYILYILRKRRASTLPTL